MDDAFFSIIIPTYNSQKTLRACLNSILEQSFTAFEILIIDGSSTDNTCAIAEEFNDKRIRIFSERDNGIYDAMNKGIKKAIAPWLYFLGSDDKLHAEDVLYKIYQYVNAKPGDMIYGNVKIIGDASWSPAGPIYDGAFTVEKLFQRNISHQAIFYNASLFKKVGLFNIEYSISADWDFNHRCFAFFKPRYIPEIIADFSAEGKSSKDTTYDSFITNDFVVNLKKYYGISFFNKAFRTCAPVFLNNAKSCLKLGKKSQSLLFFIAALYHSDSKLRILKTYTVEALRKRR